MLWPLQTSTWLCLGAAFLSATLVLTLISRAPWNEDPHFDVFDCKSVEVRGRTNPIYTSDFIFGTIVEQSLRRLSKLKSSSIRIFVLLWIVGIFIVTVG